MSTEKKSLMGTLQDLIKASEYDQQDLAKIAGVTAGTLSKYLNEKTEMPVFVFASLVKALGVSADDLLLNDEVDAEKKKKEPGVPEVLDALQILLETMEPAVKLVPYTVKSTSFDENKAVDTIGHDGNGYIASGFYDEDVEFKAIGINSEAIQDLLVSWANYKESTEKTPRLKSLFRERIFEDDVEKAKQSYDSIEHRTCAFNSSSRPMAFISYKTNSVPYCLNGFRLSLSQDVFKKRFEEVWLDGVPVEGTEQEIPNQNRDLIFANGYSLDSFDEVLETEDMSKLKRTSLYEWSCEHEQ